MKNLLNKYKYFILGFAWSLLTNNIGNGFHFNDIQKLSLTFATFPFIVYILKKLNVL